jgi:hypothetical protein
MPFLLIEELVVEEIGAEKSSLILVTSWYYPEHD